MFFLGISRTIFGARVLSSKLPPLNLVPRALFPGFGPAPKAREKRPGDEVGLLCPMKSPLVLTENCDRFNIGSLSYDNNDGDGDADGNENDKN